MTAAAATETGPRADDGKQPVDWSQPTLHVWAELAQMPVPWRRCCLQAEVGAAFRLAGQVCARPAMAAADLPSYRQAAWLRDAIAALTGCRPRMQVLTDDTGRASRQPRYLLSAAAGAAAESLIRLAQLTDPQGRPLAGMPWPVVAGHRCDCVASWRGAFLAAGSLSSPARSRPVMAVACPTLETALALAGAARRIGITARAREFRAGCQITIVGEDGIIALLDSIGCHGAAADWLATRADCRARGAMIPAPGGNQRDLTGSNCTRSQLAAAAAVRRTWRALEILGDEVPERVLAVALARVSLCDAPIHRVGELAVPPLNKDTAASRLRTLYRLADRRAAELGIPNTEQLTTAAADSS